MGRFITADWIVQNPSDPQSLNRYAYARNNPIRFVDPTGNFFIELFIAIVVGAVIGAAIGTVLATLDALVTGRPVGKAAVQGLIGGAIGGAIAGGAFATATEFFGLAAAKGIAAVVGLGLGTYGAVKNFQEGNYFSGAFSAITAFQSARQIYSMAQSQGSIKTGGGRENAKGGNGKLDSSPSSSVSGSGNEKVELKTRDSVNQTILGNVESVKEYGEIYAAAPRYEVGPISIDLLNNVSLEMHLSGSSKEVTNMFNSGFVGLTPAVEELNVSYMVFFKSQIIPKAEFRSVTWKDFMPSEIPSFKYSAKRPNVYSYGK